MAETRPSGPVVIGNDDVVLQEVAEIDQRGRLNLLQRWTKRLDWLPISGKAKADIDALMVLAEPGLLSLREWKVDGPRIEMRFTELTVAAKDGDTTAIHALRLIQDRYSRLPISSERRPYLGDAALTHLGLPIGREAKSTVYVVVLSNRIDILSPAHRNAKLLISDDRLNDLP